MHYARLVIALSAAAFLAACATTQAPVSVADTIARDPQLSTLNGLVHKAGLTESLKAAGPMTVFAPTNDAFKAVPARTMDELGTDPARLKSVLSYHVVPGKMLAADVRNSNAKTAQGANLAVGGHTLPGPGNWFEPTVLTNVNHAMAVMRDESFGPIVGIQKVASDADAVRLMNDTRYGLTAGVYTKDEAAARSLLAQVNAGSVYWNCCDRVSPRLPWSGQGDSGVGLTLSTHGILTFTRPKAWHLRKA